MTATDTATGTITDDGAAPEVTIADAVAFEGEQITFTVRLDKAVSGGLTVTPSFTDVTATKGTDYTANTAGLAFAGTRGETQTFTVATTEDAVAETAETFTVGLTVSETSVTVTATDTATGTIFEDNRPPTLTIADASASEGDSITFTVDAGQAGKGERNVGAGPLWPTAPRRRAPTTTGPRRSSTSSVTRARRGPSPWPRPRMPSSSRTRPSLSA